MIDSFPLARCLSAALLLLMFLSGCDEQKPPTEDSYAKILATIDGHNVSSLSDPALLEYQELLSYFSKRHRATKKEIANMIVTARKILKDQYSINISVIELLREVHTALKDIKVDYSFEDTTALVITLMTRQK